MEEKNIPLEENEIKLPENAYSELKENEHYKPILLSDRNYPEVNGWTVFWGIIMAIIFSAATAYSGLRFGQVFEAAIPIAIIAVGISTIAKRKSALYGKCHHSVNRSQLRSYCCRCHFHLAGNIHH
jgi:hypothetical protein